MRVRTLVLTGVIILGLTAVTAITAGGLLVASPAPTDPTQKARVASGGVGGTPQGGFLRDGNYMLARSDMTGTGGGGGMGKGGMMGDMKGGMGKGKGR